MRFLSIDEFWHNICICENILQMKRKYFEVLIQYERSHEINIWQLQLNKKLCKHSQPSSYNHTQFATV